jgi:hypothetical protein
LKAKLSECASLLALLRKDAKTKGLKSSSKLPHSEGALRARKLHEPEPHFLSSHQHQVQIHDVRPCGARDDEVSEAIEERVGVVVVQGFLQKTGAIHQRACQR